MPSTSIHFHLFHVFDVRQSVPSHLVLGGGIRRNRPDGWSPPRSPRLPWDRASAGPCNANASAPSWASLGRAVRWAAGPRPRGEAALFGFGSSSGQIEIERDGKEGREYGSDPRFLSRAEESRCVSRGKHSNQQNHFVSRRYNVFFKRRMN